jgi:hypothetical protein
MDLSRFILLFDLYNKTNLKWGFTLISYDFHNVTWLLYNHEVIGPPTASETYIKNIIVFRDFS